MEDNERLIEQFLKQNRQEIADDGFTERVMRGLPERKPQYDWLPTIWNAVMMTLALVLFIVFGGVGLVKDALYQNLDLALTQGVDMRVIFALMCAFVFYISQKAIQKA
jgi:hypothetical protein